MENEPRQGIYLFSVALLSKLLSSDAGYRGGVAPIKPDTLIDLNKI
jgi:hypothetical protein